MEYCKLFSVHLLLFLITGCATIIHGTTQDISVVTDPSGADLLVDGRERYKSPAKIILSRKNDHFIEITMDGYQKETVTIKSVLSGAVAGNIIAGGLIGWGIDAASGGQYRLVPDHIDVRLRPLMNLSIEEKLDQLQKLKDKGKLSNDEYNKLRQDIISSFTKISKDKPIINDNKNTSHPTSASSYPSLRHETPDKNKEP